MEIPLPANITYTTTLKDHPMDEALGQWNIARAAFAASVQAYLDAFSHFELACACFFASKGLDIARPDVRATLNEEALSLATHKSSIASTSVKILRLKNTSTFISPIRILPAEVLARVFMFAVDSYRTFGADPSHQDMSISQVNTMSGVCSYWRRIALSTRDLWSYIDFERLYHIDYLNLWLERASSYPLDVVNVAHSTRPQPDEDRNTRFASILPRMKCVRSMILRSSAQLMQQWISEWYTDGDPRTLTTLALSTPWMAAEFPPQGGNINQQRLRELLHFLNTLHFSELQVNWGTLTCHNLVTLSLRRLRVTADTLRHILTANPNLQYIQLMSLDIPYAPLSAALPLVQLRWLHTLHLEHAGSCQLLTTIAPGACELTLRTDDSSIRGPSEAPVPDFIAFCRRSHITTLHCLSPEILEHALAADSQIEVLYFEYMTLDNSFYDLIVPPTNCDFESSPGPLQSRLPHLHSLYLANCMMNDVEGLRRVISTSPIREIGIDHACYTENGRLYGIGDLMEWVGPEINVSYVMKERNMGYAPFGSR
ncbi:hypothetical protein BDV93DRAFT_68542 [Ceratobasidium sp. AG-I]|nr:hypothetical protein BDV93DRAFT_68542 [Ceratobasidium sp. AG-I]